MQDSTLLADLKRTLEEAAFLVSKAVPQEAHARIVKALVLVSRLEDLEYGHVAPDQTQVTFHTSVAEDGNSNLHTREREEVSKVGSRLRLWSGRPQQINTRILKTFLELQRSGVTPITEQILRTALPSGMPFDSNFAQMKIIAERNHGKVFESHGGIVTIWPPIERHVRDFERQVFSNLRSSNA